MNIDSEREVSRARLLDYVRLTARLSNYFRAFSEIEVGRRLAYKAGVAHDVKRPAVLETKLDPDPVVIEQSNTLSSGRSWSTKSTGHGARPSGTEILNRYNAVTIFGLGGETIVSTIRLNGLQKSCRKL